MHSGTIPKQPENEDHVSFLVILLFRTVGGQKQQYIQIY